MKKNIEKYKSTQIEIKYFLDDDELTKMFNHIRLCQIIVKKKDHIFQFKNIFKDLFPEYKDKDLEMNLIYDASLDGETSNDCHQKCNNIQNTVSFVSTTNNHNFCFFRSIALQGIYNGPWMADNKAFFYSFDKNKAYKIKNNKEAVGFDRDFFIQVLNVIYMSEKILTNKFNGKPKDEMNTYFQGFEEDYELTSGEKDFYVKSFKVYKLDL